MYVKVEMFWRAVNKNSFQYIILYRKDILNIRPMYMRFKTSLKKKEFQIKKKQKKNYQILA